MSAEVIIKITSKITAVVLSAVMLLPLAQPLSFAAEKPQIVQYNLIVEDNGMSTHWEDEDGNIVDLYGSSYAPAARRANARSGAYDIPSSYDARTDGLVTSVKDQGFDGSCWAFAATSCVESSIIKSGLADNTVDLSEGHLLWFAKNNLTTDASDRTYGDGENSDLNTARKIGGTWMDSVSTYARGSGPVYDADYPYSVGTWPDSDRYSAEFRLTDCSLIKNEAANISQIKRAIMDNGSVKTSYYNHTYYYNVTDTASSYYYPGATETNHDVAIVGWDDNYSKENFRSDYRPSSDGAWLVKNSWGDDILLKDGYFWMSYEEPEITDFSYYQASAKSTYDNTYQYDGLGSYSAISYLGRTTIYGANVFTADGHENLNYVGFYNTRTYMSYEINIYKLSSKTDLPTSGTLVSTVKGGEKYYGYHTAKLPEPVEVHEGDVFSVVICINAIYDEKASIATEGTMYDTAFNKYESYISMDGKTWDYVAPDSGYFKTTGNVCLKVMSSNINECKHEYTKTVVPATCTTDGYTLYTCTKCSHSYQSDPVAATGHTPAVDAGYPATCTSVGYTDGSYCSVCKEVLSKKTEIPMLEPEWSEWFHVDVNGTDMRTCLNCYGDAEGHKQTRACECKYTVEIYYNNALYSSKILSLNDYFDADSYSIPVKERPADKIAGYKTVLIPDENNPVKEDGAVLRYTAAFVLTDSANAGFTGIKVRDSKSSESEKTYPLSSWEQTIKISAAGSDFLYWTDEYGNIVSTYKNYSFVAVKNTVLTAVYGASGTDNKAYIKTNLAELGDDGSLTFWSERCVNYGKYDILSHGIIFAKSGDLASTDYNNLYNNFVCASGNSKILVQNKEVPDSQKTAKCYGMYTVSLPQKYIGSSDTWFARSYVQVLNKETGEVEYHYGDIVEYNTASRAFTRRTDVKNDNLLVVTSA